MSPKLLVFNRGEIALRACQAARGLGVRSVLFVTPPERTSVATRWADELFEGPHAEAARSFDDLALVQRAIRETGATHVYPGYGFSSEKAALATAVAAAGAHFVGPSPDVIELLGDKLRACTFAERAGLALLSLPDLASSPGVAADYPILLKARAGGGGRGNLRVDDPAAYASAREQLGARAQQLFGDSRLLAERFVERARHIELQFFGFGEQGVALLGTRDCSLQRNHQKVIEEGPAPAHVRAVVDEAAPGIRAALSALRYRGAGTLELLWDPARAQLYFLEVNARIQVEHPVTELLIGQDLVTWQLREALGLCGDDPVAALEGVPAAQAGRAGLAGHAIEARLYAEDPSAGFLPAVGQLTRLELPRLPFCRWDAGVTQGDTLTAHYDPMIAKLIVSGATRAEAFARLRLALDHTHVQGVRTNLAFLRALASDERVLADEHDTGFIERERPGMGAPAEPDEALLRDADALLALLEAPVADSAPSTWRRGHAR